MNQHTARRLTGLFSGALLVIAISLLHAQTAPRAGGTLASKQAPPPSVEELVKRPPQAAIEIAAEQMGMVRGPQRSTTSVNTIEIIATGTMAERAADGTWHDYKIQRLVEDLDFVIPAARREIVRSAPGAPSQHMIQVVAGKQAWDEEKPGINGTAVPGVSDDRALLIWLNPHAAMWGALRVVTPNGGAKIANDGGRMVITYAINGQPVKMVLNSKLLVESVQLQAHSPMYGDTTFEATYSGYKEWAGTPLSPEGYLFPCPARMIYKAGTRTIRDVTLSNCEVNPYVIFPLPANMSKASRATN